MINHQNRGNTRTLLMVVWAGGLEGAQSSCEGLPLVFSMHYESSSGNVFLYKSWYILLSVTTCLCNHRQMNMYAIIIHIFSDICMYIYIYIHTYMLLSYHIIYTYRNDSKLYNCIELSSPTRCHCINRAGRVRNPLLSRNKK